jgi:hypothetical protein
LLYSSSKKNVVFFVYPPFSPETFSAENVLGLSTTLRLEEFVSIKSRKLLAIDIEVHQILPEDSPSGNIILLSQSEE